MPDEMPHFGAGDALRPVAIGGYDYVTAMSREAEALGRIAHVGAALVEHYDTQGRLVESVRMIAIFTGQNEDPTAQFDRLGRNRQTEHPRVVALMFGNPPQGAKPELPAA